MIAGSIYYKVGLGLGLGIVELLTDGDTNSAIIYYKVGLGLGLWIVILIAAIIYYKVV